MSLGRARIATVALWAEQPPSTLRARGIDLRGGSSTAGGEAPLVLGVGRHVRGVPQVVRIAIDAVGRARLEQQDRAGRIFAQTAGEDGARRASSHDDYIGATARDRCRYRTWISFSSGR